MLKRIFGANKGWIPLVIILFLLFSIVGSLAADNIVADDIGGAPKKHQYLINTFKDKIGQQIDEVICPVKPPKIKAAIASIPEPNIAAGTKTLSSVPAFDWSSGCSATAAAMLAGYYDQPARGYVNMYDGPANSGVCPTTNAIWGEGICPLSATQQGKDGLAVKGHVDDFWLNYSSDADPYYGEWAQHAYASCTGDYMGTNQFYNWNNTDGSTTFYYSSIGAPLYDYKACESPTPEEPIIKRDGCHGIKLFVQSRGYTVATNFNQYIKGYNGNTQGFTFANYQTEINAGRPVLIQLEGHTMLGYGYDTKTTSTSDDTIYLRDTWDYKAHSMIWGKTYSGMKHMGVTVIRLAAAPAAPPVPVKPSILPRIPGTSINLMWYKINGATKYYLQVNTLINFTGTFMFDGEVGNVANKTVTGFLNNGTRYFWRVRAGNDNGWGDWSTPEDFWNAPVPGV